LRAFAFGVIPPLEPAIQSEYVCLALHAGHSGVHNDLLDIESTREGLPQLRTFSSGSPEKPMRNPPYTPGGSTPGSDAPNNGFGKPNHKAFQLAVFRFSDYPASVSVARPGRRHWNDQTTLL
jgi:hypothetical protein